MMKSFKKICLLTMLFCIGGVMANLSAQKNLEKWVEKCGTIDKVNYSIISKKDKDTKKLTTHLVSIGFSRIDVPQLYKELIDAATKDREDAISVIENKKDGVLVPQVYKFYDAKTKEYTNYIFSITDAYISIVVRVDSEETKERSVKVITSGNASFSYNGQEVDGRAISDSLSNVISIEYKQMAKNK